MFTPTIQAVLLIVAWLLGICLRLFSRASKAYRSPLRTYTSRWSFVKVNWDIFALRSFPFNFGLFELWVNHPDWLSKMVVGLGVPGALGNWIVVPPTLGTAFVAGFFGDVALDELQMRIASSPKLKWLPEILKGEIPAYDATVVDTAVTKPKEDETH